MRAGRTLAVWASGPAAGPTHAFSHLIDTDFDAALPGSFLLGRSNPADPLISRQRGDIGPQDRGRDIELDGISEVCGQLMNRAVREFLSIHRSMCVYWGLTPELSRAAKRLRLELLGLAGPLVCLAHDSSTRCSELAAAEDFLSREPAPMTTMRQPPTPNH